MSLTIEDSEIKFSTGKKIYANNGIIGLAEPFCRRWPDPKYWIISEGYDATLHDGEFPESAFPNYLTPTELHELADYMIDLWQRFKKDLT